MATGTTTSTECSPNHSSNDEEHDTAQDRSPNFQSYTGMDSGMLQQMVTGPPVLPPRTVSLSSSGGGINSPPISPSSFRRHEVLEVRDIHYGSISKEVAEALCDEPGDYLIRNGTTESDMRLTIKDHIEHSHFTIYKDKHPTLSNHVIYFLDDTTKKSLFDSVSDLMDFVCRNPGLYIGTGHYLHLRPCSKRSKRILNTMDISKGRAINSNPFSSRKYYIGKYQSLKAVLMERSDFLKVITESNIRQRFEAHPNIVQYLGITVREPIYLVLPEEARYSLHSYIKQLKSSKMQQMITICHNLCCAMIYLHSYDVVVRSLQSRGCVVNKQGVAKILDLGKSCIIEGAFMEPPPGEVVFVPTRWAAPEVLKYSRFSKASDVWSFGILMWEIFNKGKIPHHKIRNDEELIREMIPGFRLSLKPKHSKYDILLEKCQRYNSRTRPSFDFLESNMQSLL